MHGASPRAGIFTQMLKHVKLPRQSPTNRHCPHRSLPSYPGLNLDLVEQTLLLCVHADGATWTAPACRLERNLVRRRTHDGRVSLQCGHPLSDRSAGIQCCDYEWISAVWIRFGSCYLGSSQSAPARRSVHSSVHSLTFCVLL